MKLIDTHCHLYAKEFDPEQDRLMKEALDSGIETLLFPNEDLTSVNRLLSMCDRYPDHLFPMMGLHPTSIGNDWIEVLNKIEKMFTQRNYCGIGEIGMDLYWDKSFLNKQQKAFEVQLQWSIDLNLPVSIHMRSAFREVIDSIYKIGPNKLEGVFHCFTGSPEELEEVKRLTNFKIGIGGVVTYKNSHLRETLKDCPIERIVLETDAPYLPPVPYRGRRNEPTYIWRTAEKVAEIWGMNIGDIAVTTTRNALDLFKSVNTTS